MKKYNFYLIIFILSLVSILFALRNHLTINVSSSLPRGVYWLAEAEEIERGDMVLFNIPKKSEKYIHGRKYLKKDIKKLLKKVVATEKERIVRIDDRLYINGKFHSYIKSKDSNGRTLPYLSTRDLQPRFNELFVLGTNPNSFDSRYFGAINRSEIEKKAKLILKY
ncbi:conjugative transfer signal peptidase TraF [Ilyobacter sp.]|uniref:conjugative transfer signal peptidase TraF n=1 Tax=Ilyobacter sp. TaxID=3100343 RepID=UPI0035647FB4